MYGGAGGYAAYRPGLVGLTPSQFREIRSASHLTFISESLRMTEARRNKSSPPVMFKKMIFIKYFCSLNHGGAMIALHNLESQRPSISNITRAGSQFRTRNRNYLQQTYITQCLEASVERL